MRSSSASTPRTRRTTSGRTRARSRSSTRPAGFGVRVDSHVYSGYLVPPYYDSLLAKLIVWGETREEADQPRAARARRVHRRRHPDDDPVPPAWSSRTRTSSAARSILTSSTTRIGRVSAGVMARQRREGYDDDRRDAAGGHRCRPRRPRDDRHARGRGRRRRRGRRDAPGSAGSSRRRRQGASTVAVDEDGAMSRRRARHARATAVRCARSRRDVQRAVADALHVADRSAASTASTCSSTASSFPSSDRRPRTGSDDAGTHASAPPGAAHPLPARDHRRDASRGSSARAARATRTASRRDFCRELARRRRGASAPRSTRRSRTSRRTGSLSRMPIVDRNILRLAVYEILFAEDIPDSVSINEAVEMAKVYGGEDSPQVRERDPRPAGRRARGATEGTGGDGRGRPTRFEQARVRLEEIAAQVRKKDTSLEKSLDLLEEGVRLANLCTELIDQTQWRAVVARRPRRPSRRGGAPRRAEEPERRRGRRRSADGRDADDGAAATTLGRRRRRGRRRRGRGRAVRGRRTSRPDGRRNGRGYRVARRGCRCSRRVLCWRGARRVRTAARTWR